MGYIERKRKGVRSIRSEVKKELRKLKEALAEEADTRELEERVIKLARVKYELSQRVRFRSSQSSW
jgi:ribosome recycling factor